MGGGRLDRERLGQEDEEGRMEDVGERWEVGVPARRPLLVIVLREGNLKAGKKTSLGGGVPSDLVFFFLPDFLGQCEFSQLEKQTRHQRHVTCFGTPQPRRGLYPSGRIAADKTTRISMGPVLTSEATGAAPPRMVVCLRQDGDPVATDFPSPSRERGKNRIMSRG